MNYGTKIGYIFFVNILFITMTTVSLTARADYCLVNKFNEWSSCFGNSKDACEAGETSYQQCKWIDKKPTWPKPPNNKKANTNCHLEATKGGFKKICDKQK
jgi:hypothetical protein